MESRTAEREGVRMKTERHHSPQTQEVYKSPRSYVRVGTSLLPVSAVVTHKLD